MLHSHVLPQHVEYARLLQNARYIVLDEDCRGMEKSFSSCQTPTDFTQFHSQVHIYRGAFGAHVCNIIRRPLLVVPSCILLCPLEFDGFEMGGVHLNVVRFRRLVDEASLRFVACSATVANPGECPGYR